MAIPNTTPTPNELYNGEMRKMNDTELRIVLVVTRATLGWELDKETGTRKKEDWISRSQIIDKTGRSGRAISTAIESCMQKGWIEARNKDGEMLDTPQKRSGKRIFYRLGKIFLRDIETSEESSLVGETSEKSAGENSSLYKRNILTKRISLRAGDKVVDKSNADDYKRKSDRIAYEADRTFGRHPNRPRMSLLMKIANEKGEDVLIGALGRIREYIREGERIEDFTPYLVSMCQKKEVDVNA